ncbi:MAG: tetratricopeptide repeat protein [Janthinobacterium lividum]
MPDGIDPIATARAALAARPDEPRALFTLAALLLRAGDPEAATLLPHLDRHDGFAGGWLTIGDALLARGRTDASLIAIERGLRSLPARTAADQASRARHLLGRALLASGQDGEALAVFEQAVALDPAFAEAWYSLALLHQDHGRHAAAAASYRSALNARPDFHEAALNLGVALGECGLIEDALDAYAQALALRPASFGRIAQSLVSGRTGLMFLDPGRLRANLTARVRPVVG